MVAQELRWREEEEKKKSLTDKTSLINTSKQPARDYPACLAPYANVTFSELRCQDGGGGGHMGRC